jgi:Big-like domain-containing protein/cadherin-like protein
MTDQHLRALCAACACALLLSGCGGGGGRRNQAPTANDLTISTNEDTPQTASITASDPDGDALTAAVATPPAHGDVVTNGTSITYTPRANQNGSDEFTLRISDGRGGSATATVHVTIAAINDAPRIQPTLALDEDQPATTQIATEVDGETLQLTLVTPPTHGTVALDPATAGRITYTPNANYFGADTMQFTAVDASTNTTTTAVQITVRPVNDAPVVVADEASTTQTGTVVADVLANDSDVDDTTLTLSIVTPPAHGTATVTAGRIEYSSGTFIGETALTYQARDAAGATANGTLTLRSAVRSPIVYATTTSTELYFSDGVRSFKLHQPLPQGARVTLLKAAKSAPLVFFRVADAFTNELFYADLRQPGIATRLSRDFTIPGEGVGDFVVSDDGSKVVYTANTGGVGGSSDTWVVETAHPGVEIRLGQAGSDLAMDAAGTRVVYAVRPFTPTQQPSAIFSVELANPGVETRVTPFAQPTDSIGGPIYFSRDGHTLYYSITNQVYSVDPAQPGSDSLVFDVAPTPTSLLGPLDDETTFTGLTLNPIDGYVQRVGHPGSRDLFSAGTPNGEIRAHAATLGGTRVFYLRAPPNSVNADLYRVDMSNPTVSTRIADHSTKFDGIINFALSPDASRIFYATLDVVPLTGGGLAPGNADIFFLPTDGSAAQPLQHFDAAAQIGKFAPDGGYCVVEVGLGSHVHAFNALDPGQNVQLDTLSGDAGVSEYLFVVAP